MTDHQRILSNLHKAPDTMPTRESQTDEPLPDRTAQLEAMIRKYYQWIEQGIATGDQTLDAQGYREWRQRMDEMQSCAEALLEGKQMSEEQHTSQEWALALDQLAENTFFAWRLIIVNGRKLPIPGDEASYEAIVSLALGKVPPKDVLYTVVYGRGPAEKPEGSLLPGGSVKVRDGMVFSVANTGNA